MKVFHTMVSCSYAALVTCSAVDRDTRRSNIEARATWSYSGCYIDNVSGRALQYLAKIPGGSSSMTNEACQAACQSAGYSIAGTEYSGECWCGNTVDNGSGPAPDRNAGCDMKCKGNAAEICGGRNRLTLYQNLSSGTGKRGLAYNSNNPNKSAIYANMFKGYSKVSWGYDWGFPSWGLDPFFEFSPMLWGKPSGDDPNWTAAVETAGTNNILGFNEPDLTYQGSANILPATAASGYVTYMEPFQGTVNIGMPNVLWNNDHGSSSGGKYSSRVWMQYFLGNCTSCHFDFAAIHYYQDCEPAGGQDGVAWFQGNVTDAYNVLQLPVWITEFQCYGTEAQQIKFLERVLPWLDAQSYVARYAYFGVFPDKLINHNGTSLSDLGITYATT